MLKQRILLPDCQRLRQKHCCLITVKGPVPLLQMCAEPLNLTFQFNYHKVLKLFSLQQKCWGPKIQDRKQRWLACVQPSVRDSSLEANTRFSISIWMNSSGLMRSNRTEQIRRDSSIPALRGSVGIFEFKHTNVSQDGSGCSFSGRSNLFASSVGH